MMMWILPSLVSLMDRLAAELLTPYGQAYSSLLAARHAEDERYITAAERQLSQIRAAMSKLVGPARAKHLCQQVEDAVAEGSNYIDLEPQDEQSEEKKVEGGAASPRSRSSSESEKKSVTRSPRGSPSKGPGQNSKAYSGATMAESKISGGTKGVNDDNVEIPQALSGLLRNEMLAHEIILNPDFKIPEPKNDERSDQTPEGSAMAQIKETMERIFWDRLVFSLTPAEQEGPSDFHVGSMAHVRYQGPHGSFFRAIVEKINEDGSIDVMYPEDGIKETRVPISRCRLKTDPLDFRPLLSLLEEVREKLIELTPNRRDIANDLREKVDTDLLRQMLEQGVFDPASVWALLGFLVQHIISLEAPVRASETELWFKHLQAEAGGSMKDLSLLVPTLPRVFQYLFDKVEEIKRDVANAHVEMIRPFLARHGVGYERQKFAERLKSGEQALNNTQEWLATVLNASSEGLRHRVSRGDTASHKQVLVQAFLHLLKLPVRLDTPAAYLPETLAWDGRRLAGIRDELDRLSLIAVYSTLLRQFLAQARTPAPVAAIEELESRLYTILQQDDGVKLDHLVDECVEATKRLFAAHGGRVPTHEQLTTLRGVLSNAASVTNPVFSLMFGRLLEVLGLYMQGRTQQAEDVIARYGFRPFAVHLKTTGTQLGRIFSHNMEVHGVTHSIILKEEATTIMEGTGEGKA